MQKKHTNKIVPFFFICEAHIRFQYTEQDWMENCHREPIRMSNVWVSTIVNGCEPELTTRLFNRFG